MNERQPNLPEHGDFSGWQRRKTRLEWLSEGYQSKLLAVLLKGGQCNFWDLLDCDDRISPWWASRVGPQHDTVMFSMSFNSYASLAIFFIIPVLFCFVFEHETMYTQAWPISNFYSRYRYTIKLKGDEDTGIPDLIPNSSIWWQMCGGKQRKSLLRSREWKGQKSWTFIVF